MKNIIRSNNHILKQKKKYMFLLTILLIGLISGIIFIFLIKNNDKELIKNNYNQIFNTKGINTFKTFINSLSYNFISLLIIYVLAVSIIGLPIIILYLFIKGFIFGITISSIISIYGFKGILLSLSYIFPHQLVLLFLYVIISFYAISFSLKLFKFLFFKENISLNKYFLNMNKKFLIGVGVVVICALIEGFLSPFLIDLCI